ncbi:MAG: histidine phosphatase family protein [Acidobacteriota bacterium]
MKSLYILRHAKSDWTTKVEGDHERPLNKRGSEAAQLMGSFLTAIDQIPDRILSSTATRALATAELASSAGNWQRPIEFESLLYGADRSTVLRLIRDSEVEGQRLLIVGHEPTCSSLMSALVGGCRIRFPTAALGRVDLEIERWSEIDAGIGSLLWLVTPKLLRRTMG